MCKRKCKPKSKEEGLWLRQGYIELAGLRGLLAFIELAGRRGLLALYIELAGLRGLLAFLSSVVIAEPTPLPLQPKPTALLSCVAIPEPAPPLHPTKPKPEPNPTNKTPLDRGSDLKPFVSAAVRHTVKSAHGQAAGDTQESTRGGRGPKSLLHKGTPTL